MQRAIAAVPPLASPEIADAMRRRVDRIIHQWRIESARVIPRFDQLSPSELEDDVPQIIEAIAEAVGSDNFGRFDAVFNDPPSHGIERYIQNFGLRDLFIETRIFRTALVEQVEEELARSFTTSEMTLLHSVIDIIFQQSVIALVERQKEETRRTAELQLKFLAYFSHDLNNQFLVVTLQLEQLRKDLEAMAAGDGESKSSIEQKPTADFFESIAQRLNDALKTIQQTRGGMRKMLDHERLRVGAKAEKSRTNIRELVESQARRLAEIAEQKSIIIVIDVPEDCEIETDQAIVTILLQNLLDNAIKHSDGGTVRISGEQRSERSEFARETAKRQCRISVSDQGPGISPEKQKQIFEAFNRGDALGTPGMGLGLVIASQAADLLSTTIELESQPGVGSTFSFTLHG